MYSLPLSEWTIEQLLRRRSNLRDDLNNTPHHLYPLTHATLRSVYYAIDTELSRRADELRVTMDELEAVGDVGTIEDALERLRQRQAD